MEERSVADTSSSPSLRVLMISLDPGFFDSASGTGNTLERHQRYAALIDSLDIVILGGATAEQRTLGNLTLWSTGRKGFGGVLKGLQLARRIARERQCSLVVTQDPHATGWIGMRLKREFGIPLLVDVHGDFFQNRAWLSESWKNRIFATVQHSVVANADRIRAVSFGIRDTLRAARVPEGRIRVINTPINDEVFVSFDDHQRILLEELKFKYQNTKLIVFSGRLVAAKNLHFLLRVAAALKKKRKDWMLLIIGDGDLRTDLEKEVQRHHLGSHVQFIGIVNHRDLAVYYTAAVCLVLPSTNESFGKVIIEAGLTGTATLASSTTGAQHIIIDGRTGFIAPIDDLDAFVGILDEMLEYPEQTKQLGDWAKEEYLQRYRGSETIARIVALWKETASV